MNDMGVLVREALACWYDSQRESVSSLVTVPGGDRDVGDG